APIAGIIFLVGGIVTGIADYYTNEEYTKLKEEGLKRMKECYETQYEILAWQAIQTEEKTSEAFTEDFLKQGVQGVSNVLGPTIKSIAPEVKEAIDSIGSNYFWGTLNLKADPIKGLSLINLYGTIVYQVHFDCEATIKWYAKNDCNIDLCDQQADGTYKCLSKQGYFLFDENGNMIFDGPQAAFLQWSNLETYASMPQKVINIKQAPEKFMEIYNDKILVTNDCIYNEIDGVTKMNAGTKGATGDSSTKPGTASMAAAPTKDVKQVFGAFDVINTENEIVWMEGTTVAVEFLKQKSIGETTYSATQTERFENSHLEIARDGSVTVRGAAGSDMLGGALQMSSEGVISFDNAMIIPGKAPVITRGGKTYTASYSYNAMGGGSVLHLFIRDLLTVSAKDLEGLSLAELCADDKGTQGVTMTGKLSTDADDSLKALLAEICMNHFEGTDGTIVEIRDGKICTTTKDGETTCKDISRLEGGRLYDETGGWWAAGVGPDGIPLWNYFNAAGQQQMSIPLLWASGLGGAMRYDASSGQISIKNEFPFAINPAFNQYGALATPGMAIPASPEWGGRVKGTGEGAGQLGGTQPNILAQLPLLPESPYYLAVFIIILMSSLVMIRAKYGVVVYKKKQ
ncbi:MAG: hypothetical protein QXO69_03095, partial [archaeon]